MSTERIDNNRLEALSIWFHFTQILSSLSLPGGGSQSRVSGDIVGTAKI